MSAELRGYGGGGKPLHLTAQIIFEGHFFEMRVAKAKCMLVVFRETATILNKLFLSRQSKRGSIFSSYPF